MFPLEEDLLELDELDELLELDEEPLELDDELLELDEELLELVPVAKVLKVLICVVSEFSPF